MLPGRRLRAIHKMALEDRIVAASRPPPSSTVICSNSAVGNPLPYMVIIWAVSAGPVDGWIPCTIGLAKYTKPLPNPATALPPLHTSSSTESSAVPAGDVHFHTPACPSAPISVAAVLIPFSQPPNPQSHTAPLSIAPITESARTSTRVPPAVLPREGRTLKITPIRMYMNATPSWSPETWSARHTRSVTSDSQRLFWSLAGDSQRKDVSEIRCARADAPPNAQTKASSAATPLCKMVTSVPPSVGPADGITAWMTGSSTTCTPTFPTLKSAPLLLSSSV